MHVRQNAALFEERKFSRLVSRWMRDIDGNVKILSGSFNDGSTIWIAQQSKLLVIDSQTGDKVSQFQFGPNFVIDCGVPFLVSKNQECLLLGVCSGDKYLVCAFDVIANRLLSSTAVPHRVHSLRVIVNANRSMPEASLKIHSDLKKWSSLIAVGTARGQVYLYDLALHGCTAINTENNPFIPRVYSVEEDFSRGNGLLEITDFLCTSNSSLGWPDGEDKSTHVTAATTAVTALYFVQEACVLSIGFSFGGVLLYSLECLQPVYFSPFEPNAAAVMQFALVEPEDDPRPTLYLWALRDNACCIDGICCGTDAPSLEMYQLNFRQRIQSNSVENLYTELTLCISRLYWVPDSCSTLLNCTTLNMWLEYGKPCQVDPKLRSSRIFLYFFWISKNRRMMGCLFDVNSWYHAQMPHDVFASREYNVCPFVAWHFYGDVDDYSGLPPLACIPLQHSIVRNRQLPDTQFNYFACSYSLNVDTVTQDGVKRYFVQDIQNLVLDHIATRGIEGLSEPAELFSLLQHAKLTSVSDYECSKEQMRRHVWSSMLENGRLNYLTSCFLSSISTDSALLEEFVQWAWLQAVASKDRLDNICGSLFGSNTLGISDGGKRTLQKEALNLELLLDAHSFCRQRLGLDAVSAGGIKLGVRELALQETCLFTNVVLWFIDAGVLPEKGFYVWRAIQESHKNATNLAARERRTLLIDQLASELNESLKLRPVEGFDGPISYPLKTFRDLLSVYLISNADTVTKHAFVLYTLLDLTTVSNVDEEVPKKFAKDVVSAADPFLADFASLLWHIDKGDSEAASRHLLDALVAMPRNAKWHRLGGMLTPAHYRSFTRSTSLALVLPTFSFDSDQANWRQRRRRGAQLVNGTMGSPTDSSIVGRSIAEGLASRYKPTPLKRRAPESFTDTNDSANEGPAKKARRVTVAGIEIARSEELSCQPCFEEAKSLLKAPQTITPRTVSIVAVTDTTPVSILRSNRSRRLERESTGSSYLEKSLRFALPTGSEDSSKSIMSPQLEGASSPLAVSHDSDAQSVPPNVRTYQSPSDEEITFVYSRHRWSLAGIPSPPTNAAKDGSNP